MRRADRLFEILQLLGGGRLRTAKDLAQRLEVSTRTIWRDVSDLQAQGVPIDGARGAGYLLRETFFLPPLALKVTEMEALSWGVQFIETYGDELLAEAARELRIKIHSVSPEGRVNRQTTMSAFASTHSRSAKAVLRCAREAIVQRNKLRFVYRNLRDHDSERTVRPLSLEFWGNVWTLTAWCELREDFRVFRCDRIEGCRVLTDRFKVESGKRLEDFVAAMQAPMAAGGRES